MRTSTILAAAVLAAGAALAGCAETGSTETTTTAAQVRPAAGYACPMDVPDASVALVDTKGEAALDFTTTAGEVTELRDRVNAMAVAHNRAPSGLMMMSEGVPGQAWVFGSVTLPLSSASVTEIPGGARLVLRAARSAELSLLQHDIGAWATRLSYGECPVAPSAM